MNVIEREVSWRIWSESRRFQERGRPKGGQREEVGLVGDAATVDEPSGWEDVAERGRELGMARKGQLEVDNSRKLSRFEISCGPDHFFSFARSYILLLRL